MCLMNHFFIDYFCKFLKIVKKYLNNFPLIENEMLKSRILSVYGQKVLILKCSISCAKDELRYKSNYPSILKVSLLSATNIKAFIY